MENFSYYSPTLFEFGRGAEEKVGMLTFLTGATKLLIVYGRKYAKTNGLIDRITNSLNTLGIEHVELGGVEPNPTDTLVYEGIKLARAKKSRRSSCRWRRIGHRHRQSHRRRRAIQRRFLGFL